MIEYLPLVLTGIGIIVSILYYTSVLRNQNRTRQAQLFTQLYKDYRTPENLSLMSKAMQMNWNDYDEFQSKYSSITQMEERLPYTFWSMYFQEIGILLKEGFIDITLVAQFLPDFFRGYWKKFEPIILEERKRTNYPQYFGGMEFLYNEFCKHRGHEP